MKHEDLSAFEYVFCWLGNTELLLSIIKLMEDKMNLENDLKAGVLTENTPGKEYTFCYDRPSYSDLAQHALLFPNLRRNQE